MIKLYAGAALLMTAVAPAAAATYTTATAQFNGLGDQIGSQFDMLTLNGVTGTATGPGTYLINTVDFTVGLNSNGDHTDTGTLADTGTVKTTTYNYSVPYTIAISSTDTITLGGNTLYGNGYRVHFNALTLTSGGPTVSGDLTATVSVPEPATWAMMVTGFGLVGLGVRRRRPTAVAA